MTMPPSPAVPRVPSLTMRLPHRPLVFALSMYDRTAVAALALGDEVDVELVIGGQLYTVPAKVTLTQDGPEGQRVDVAFAADDVTVVTK